MPYSDPTREEMIERLKTEGELFKMYGEVEAIDLEAAIYWFASDNHDGQASNLYSVLSTSSYKPGPMENIWCASEIVQDLYDDLVDIFLLE